MKYLRQLLMILIFSFIGEVLHAVIPIQMPASIYGLVLLFIALMTGLVKLPQVHEAARGTPDMIGKLFMVKLTECKGFYYLGEIAENA